MDSLCLTLHLNTFTCNFCSWCVLCLVAQLCTTLCNPLDWGPPGSPIHGDSPGKNTGVDCHVLLQGIFPTQGWNPGLPHCRRIHYHLSHQGSPRILEWVAYPFSRRSSLVMNWTRVSCIAGGFFYPLSYQSSWQWLKIWISSLSNTDFI